MVPLQDIEEKSSHKIEESRSGSPIIKMKKITLNFNKSVESNFTVQRKSKNVGRVKYMNVNKINAKNSNFL